jgi:hypothetical protein
LRKVSLNEAKLLAEKENMMYFEISAKTGEGLKRMIFASIAELPFFEQFKIEKNEDLVNELGIIIFYTNLEIENSDHNLSKQSNNLSILDSSRGTIQFNRSEIINKKINNGQCKCSKQQ